MTRIRMRARRGVSLLEVVFAISILSTTLLGMAEYGRRYSHTNGTASLQSLALDLATARVERVKAERNYTSMDTLATTESSIPGYAGFSRTTYITRITTSQVDYKTVTVKVSNSALSTPIKKTTAISRF